MAQSAAHKHESLRRATYQDVLDAPAHRVAEIIDGTLYTHPRPAMLHALANSVLGHDLGNPFQFGRGGPGGWWLIDEPELHLGEDILVPDLAGRRRDRMPDYPDTAYVTLAPDWVCEVLSSLTRKVDLHEKRPKIAGRSDCRLRGSDLRKSAGRTNPAKTNRGLSLCLGCRRPRYGPMCPNSSR